MGLRDLDRHARRLRESVHELGVPEDVAGRFGAYRGDPCRFARRVIGVELMDYQEAVLRDVASSERVAWVAGHAVGKSYVGAVLLAWFLLTRPRSRTLASRLRTSCHRDSTTVSRRSIRRRTPANATWPELTPARSAVGVLRIWRGSGFRVRQTHGSTSLDAQAG